ncbi:FAD-dependent monooxygenase [Streptomyces sp. NPDC091266]|uniref:FAD-dependent monooxygenase n=1 Tax=Streptomyces sp. NPDC091266 TaxID=3365978 RepID=UPI0038164572
MNGSRGTSGAGLHFRHPHLAVVLGGGFTGMLAAAALSEHADVVVVERERLPRTRALPTDLPQARHAQLLASDGARIVESLLPGTVERWLAAGARRVPLPPGLAGLPPQGRLRKPRERHLIACSPDLLDRTLRQLVSGLPGVRVIDGTEAGALTGTAEHVTGVQVRCCDTGETYRLDADLVVDATGRNSTTPARLAALDLPAVREEAADTGVVCATRIFRAPDGQENCPVIAARADAHRPALPGPESGHSGWELPGPGSAGIGMTATLVPIEDGRWLVTLTGAGADRPSAHADRFVPFARRLPHSTVADLIAGAEPLSEVRLSRDTANRRRHYEHLASWPSGFVVLGGAVAAFNPDCGQGLSTAAHGAAALRDALQRRGLDDVALARGVQRSVGRIVHAPWATATRRGLIPDPGATAGVWPSATARLARTANRVLSTAVGAPAVRRAYAEEAPPPTAPVAPVRRPTDATGLATTSVQGPSSPLPRSRTESRRLPRPLVFGPTALRRLGNYGRRKPTG